MSQPNRNPLIPPWPFEAYAHILSPYPGRPGEYQVVLPDLPEFWASGHSQADALANAKANFPGHIRRWVHIYLRKVPPPRFTPAPPRTRGAASGRFVIRMGITLHSELRRQALAEGISMNALVAQLLGGSQVGLRKAQPARSTKAHKRRYPQGSDKASKAFLARIGTSLHGAMSDEAMRQGVSLNMWITTALAEQLAVRTHAHQPAVPGT